MKKHQLITIFSLAIALSLCIGQTRAKTTKKNLKKAIITNIDNFTLTAAKNNRTYLINAQRAILQNAKNKRATIDQFFINDQIDVRGTTSNGTIIAKTIKDRSLKPGDLTRRSVGAENIKEEAISDLNFISNGVITEDKLQQGTITNTSISPSASIDSSKLNLSNISSLTANTANITTLDLGTNTIADGNFTGNWNFNSGNLSNVGTISSGDITTSGTITALTDDGFEGTHNNYFAGNVGIGTTGGPCYGKLLIRSTGAADHLRFEQTGSSHSWYLGMRGDGGTDNGMFEIYSGGLGTVTRWDPSTGYLMVGLHGLVPQSRLQVQGGYFQLDDNNSGAPAGADCDAAAEEGRMYWDATNDNLYVCSGASGWRKVTTVAP